MKKSLLALTALAALSMLFMGCPKSSGNDTSDPTDTTEEETVASYSVDFTQCTIKDAYCGTYDGTNDVVADDGTVIISVDSEGVLTMAGYSWDKTYITLPEATDLSGYTKMTISAKVSEGYSAGDAVIFELASGDSAASGYSTWADSSFFGDLSEDDYTSFSVTMSNLANMGENSVYGTDDADFSAITEIAINPRGASGNIYISEIKFE